MKRLTIILTLLLSFGFSQIMMPDTSKMSNTEKMRWYQDEKKSPALALFFSSIMLTSGHAYAGDWKRGIKFLGYEILAIGAGSIIAYCSEEYLSGRTLAGTGYIIAASIPIYVYILDKIDAAKTASKYNNQLYKNLFGTPPSMQFNLIPQPKGIGLGLSYNF